ncbi:uncharacterized protein LOC132066404 [Lycium ferocissimum]|uniref:uncharacterized protein LOC132066404 n=1 Tax=Lycium ferocissimum TaxID=112874 RepID=UPI002814FE39|nr:uncharacterized protein LOC132066404 [Lycium ferocissimum]
MISKNFKPQTTSNSPLLSSPPCPVIHNINDVNPYRDEFSVSMLEDLSFELDNYIDYAREVGNDFSNLKRLGDLSETLVKTNLHKTWRLVYLLVKLSLILPVATATVERAFSSMKCIKNELRGRIGDEFLNDC